MRCPLCNAIFTVGQTVPEAEPVAPAATSVTNPASDAPQVAAPSEPSTAAAARQIEYVTEHEPTSAVARATRRSGDSGGLLRQLIGTLIGGAVGLTVGYCVLIRFGGVEYDFLKVADYLPRFVVGETEAAPEANIAAPPVDLALHAHEQEIEVASLPEPQPLAELFPPSEFVAMEPLQPLVPVLPENAVDDSVDVAVADDRFPEGYLGPRGVRYSVDELDEALARLHRTLGCVHCSSTGQVRQVSAQVPVTEDVDDGHPVECPICNGHPGQNITLDVYHELAELAQVAAFVHIADDDPNLESRRRAMIGVLERAGATRASSKAIGRLGGQRLRDASRTTDGVALAGTVRKVTHDGTYHVTRMVLFGLPRVVTILSQRPAPWRAGNRVMVLGSIVDDPREKLARYRGDATQVVWGGLPVILSFGDD